MSQSKCCPKGLRSAAGVLAVVVAGIALAACSTAAPESVSTQGAPATSAAPGSSTGGSTATTVGGDSAKGAIVAPTDLSPPNTNTAPLPTTVNPTPTAGIQAVQQAPFAQEDFTVMNEYYGPSGSGTWVIIYAGELLGADQVGVSPGLRIYTYSSEAAVGNSQPSYTGQFLLTGQKGAAVLSSVSGSTVTLAIDTTTTTPGGVAELANGGTAAMLSGGSAALEGAVATATFDLASDAFSS